MAGAECPKTEENREGVILFDLFKKKNNNNSENGGVGVTPAAVVTIC